MIVIIKDSRKMPVTTFAATVGCFSPSFVSSERVAMKRIASMTVVPTIKISAIITPSIKPIYSSFLLDYNYNQQRAVYFLPLPLRLTAASTAAISSTHIIVIIMTSHHTPFIYYITQVKLLQWEGSGVLHKFAFCNSCVVPCKAAFVDLAAIL